MYYNNNYRNYSRKPQRKQFIEDRDAAFFLGKLNKHHNRETLYNQLKRLTKELNFYIVKFDMPNGLNGRGNQGFAFVHTKSKEQARRIIALKHLRLGNQECEVKGYDGRTDVESTDVSGRETPDSGFHKVINNKPRHLFNPLNNEKRINEWKQESFPIMDSAASYDTSVDTRSRINSGISSRFSGKSMSRPISESESHEEHKPINSEFNADIKNNNKNDNNNSNVSQNQQTNTTPTEDIGEGAGLQNNYEPSLVNSLNQVNSINPDNTTSQSHNADSDFHDQWLEEQTRYVCQKLASQSDIYNTLSFITNCDGYMRMLSELNEQQVTEVQDIMNGRPIHV
jgi:hypothetical protein